MDAKKTPPEKDAIIFIPGLGRRAVDQRLETIARKMAGALDRQASRPELTFKMIGMPDEEYGNSFRARVQAIGVGEPGEVDIKPLADIYELDYQSNLTRRFDGRNPFSKVLVMISVLIPIAWRSIRAVRHRGKELKDKLQMLTLAFIMLAVAAFTVMMLVAGAQTLKEVGTYGPVELIKTSLQASGFESDKETTSPGVQNPDAAVSRTEVNERRPNPSDPGESEEKATDQSNDRMAATSDSEETAPQLGVFQALIVLFAALGLFNKASLKETISVVATEYVCASNYLRMANQKQLILGQFMALLEHIAEKKEKYKNIHVVAYSFGTLLAIDSLFPHTRPGARLSRVQQMVTIGCPFDLVRTYYPNYFSQRLRPEGSPARWTNLYAPLDVFGSNFRNDSRRLESDQGVTLQSNEAEMITPHKNIAYDVGLQIDQLKWFDVLTVKGMKLHGGYWTDEETPDLNCFDNIVPELFGSQVGGPVSDPPPPEQ